MSDKKLTGFDAIIMGASSGLGLVMAYAFAAKGSQGSHGVP